MVETSPSQATQLSEASAAVTQHRPTVEGEIVALGNMAERVVALASRADKLPREDTQFLLSRELADLQAGLEKLQPALLPPSLRPLYERLLQVIKAAPSKLPFETRLGAREIQAATTHWLERADGDERQSSNASTVASGVGVVGGHERSGVRLQWMSSVLVAQLCLFLVVITAWRVAGPTAGEGDYWRTYVVTIVVLIVALDFAPLLFPRWSK